MPRFYRAWERRFQAEKTIIGDGNVELRIKTVTCDLARYQNTQILPRSLRHLPQTSKLIVLQSLQQAEAEQPSSNSTGNGLKLAAGGKATRKQRRQPRSVATSALTTLSVDNILPVHAKRVRLRKKRRRLIEEDEWGGGSRKGATVVAKSRKNQNQSQKTKWKKVTTARRKECTTAEKRGNSKPANAGAGKPSEIPIPRPESPRPSKDTSASLPVEVKPASVGTRTPAVTPSNHVTLTSISNRIQRAWKRLKEHHRRRKEAGGHGEEDNACSWDDDDDDDEDLLKVDSADCHDSDDNSDADDLYDYDFFDGDDV